MVLKRSAKFGNFSAVTSFMAPFTDFSSVNSCTSSVALTSLSPDIMKPESNQSGWVKVILRVLKETVCSSCKQFAKELTVAA